jgi:hypothetical protein
MAEPTNEHKPRTTLEIFSEKDWVGTLTVGCYQHAERSLWWWQVSNGKGQMLDAGDKLEMAGPQTPREAIRVLLVFLLSTVGSPIKDFNEASTEWARVHCNALASAMEGM